MQRFPNQVFEAFQAFFKILVFFFLTFLPFYIFSNSNNSETSVNFLNWADYLPPNLPQDFQDQTGIKINQSFYDGDEMLEAKLVAGSTGYDVILPALVDMDEEIKFNLVQPLNKNWLPNYSKRNEDLYKIAAKIDPDNTYGVIYQYGTTGIAYNADLIKQYLGDDLFQTLPIESNNWDMLLSPKYLKKLSKCGVAFLDSANQVYGITLSYLGLDPNSTHPEDYKKATAYLLSIRPYIAYFSNFKYRTDLASGNICIAMGYSGDVLESQAWAREAGDPIHLTYVIPKSGAPIWFDMLAIPQNAPNVRAAHEWINYLIDPKVMASISNYLIQPNAIPESTAYLNQNTKNSLSDISILNDETISHAFSVHNVPPSLKPLFSQLWFKVKYGE